MEDELASMAAILGASWGGMKAMTSTSGPGFSLMMENISLGLVPRRLRRLQRAAGWPSTGLPTLVAQADMMQARWGATATTNHRRFAFFPQEMFDFTVWAFNLSSSTLPVILWRMKWWTYDRAVVIPPGIRFR